MIKFKDRLIWFCMLRNDGGKIIEVLFSVFQPLSIRDGMYRKNREIYNMLGFDRRQGVSVNVCLCCLTDTIWVQCKTCKLSGQSKGCRETAWCSMSQHCQNTGFITFDFEWIFGCSIFRNFIAQNLLWPIFSNMIPCGSLDPEFKERDIEEVIVMILFLLMSFIDWIWEPSLTLPH